MTVRIAMWSGPRNISTALMRSWSSRDDCAVLDEPFYACYLRNTGIDHPGRDEVMRSQSTECQEVVEQVTRGPVAGVASIQYQKHMAHHLLPDVDRSALGGLHHAFLVRDPAEVLVSYAKVRGEPTLEDLGLPQQVELFERFGGPVVDARDVLEQPESTLRSLCDALGVPFDGAMLAWPSGAQPTDGVWGRYWYDNVWRSTGFASYRASTEPVPPGLEPLLRKCRPYYEAMTAYRTTS